MVTVMLSVSSHSRPMKYNRLTLLFLFLSMATGWWSPLSVQAGFLPPQSQILSDLVLANNYFTNEWPVPGCSKCLPANHPSNIWTRGTYFEGDLALYRINRDPNIYNYAVQ